MSIYIEMLEERKQEHVVLEANCSLDRWEVQRKGV